MSLPRNTTSRSGSAVQRCVVIVVAMLLAVTACSSSASKGGGSPSSVPAGSAGAKLSGSITVDAASSLTEAFNAIKDQFIAANPGVHVTINYGASSDLSTMINNGAPVDVFASASTKNMTAVKQASNPTNFVSNTLEIATPPSNPGKISSVRDLAKSGLKVAICDPAVPCGVVAAKVFANAKITVKPTATEADVKSTLAAVESGEVDAGLVYVTDVRSAGSKVRGVQIPDNLNASTDYPIAALSSAKNPSLAKAFVAYVLSTAGSKVLTADGFHRP